MPATEPKRLNVGWSPHPGRVGVRMQQAGSFLSSMVLPNIVEHSAVSELSPNAEVVISHSNLSARVRQIASQAAVYAVEDFITSPVYDQLVAELGRRAKNE